MNSSRASPVVLDCGTLNCKAGFADVSKRAPDFVVQTSEPFQSSHADGAVGSPIQNGHIEDWDSMEVLWDHIFKEKMKIDPSQYPVLLSEPDGILSDPRKKTLQVFFESFNVPALHLANQGILTLYSIGQASGLVIQSGHGLTNIMTARDGHRPTFGRVPLLYTGRKMTEYTQELIAASLREHSVDVKTVDFHLAEKFKEEHGYVRMLGEDKPSRNMVPLDISGKTYSVNAGDIGAKIGEAFFDPSVLGLSCFGLAKAVLESIELSDDEDWMDELYLKTILLAGGNTMFRGLQERLTAEVDKIKFQPFMTVNVKAPPYRAFSSWVGGSVIASLPTFDPCWITKLEYEEYGSGIFRRKCLPY